MKTLSQALPAHAAGVKEALRAVRSGRAVRVSVATDATDEVLAELLAACRERNIPIERKHTREELGKSCRLPVKTAAVARLA
ncbi:MAG: ribosomal L7Ae/L30e/S12e/Gadd45 family protein [Veillonellaceae bacterium]|nr:ribosomal L7Ae/L30e/S12e/Gadd45 family protein [Veillonellaceae bacterium]